MRTMGRLVGKSERHDAEGGQSQVKQVHNFIREHTGLARPGARYHKLWPVAVEHSLPLLFIELL